MATHPNVSLACTLVVIQGKGILRSMPWQLFHPGQSDKLKLLPFMQGQHIQHSYLLIGQTYCVCRLTSWTSQRVKEPSHTDYSGLYTDLREPLMARMMHANI